MRCLDSGDMFAVLSLGIAIGFFIGMWITARFNNKDWRDESVEKGFGEYNAKTGEWQWKGTTEAP